ncbi:hypothetical protein F2Q68_00019410 [Brassica cretica]|uniref:Uncharacterized protein n=1 Tax=Brassica cretica TaxID=69181 RepID=A0A8S9FZC6_BRACR|nr:hypothetical protein F2Q68_00019410 [Brassica cretica]
MGLSEDSVRDFTVFLGYLYMVYQLQMVGYSLVSVKGVAEGFKDIDLCGVRLNRLRCQIEIDLGWKHVCFGFPAWDSVVVCFGFSKHMRGRTNGSTGYHGSRVVIKVLQELQVSIDISWKLWRRGISRFVVTITVGEIMMRDLQGMQRYLQEREDSLKLQQEGCTCGRVCDQQCWRLI